MIHLNVIFFFIIHLLTGLDGSWVDIYALILLGELSGTFDNQVLEDFLLVFLDDLKNPRLAKQHSQGFGSVEILSFENFQV